jgi:hypothetical protein
MCRNPELLVTIAEPAGRGSVAGIALPLQDRLPFDLADLGPAEELQRLLGRDRIGEIPEVDDADEFLRAHVRNQLPDRFAGFLGPEVPDGIDDRTRGEVDGALVRPDPAQLAVSREIAPEPAGVVLDKVEVKSDHEVAHGLNGGTADVVAAPDGEGEAVTRQIRMIGREYHIGGGIVRVRVHRIRAVEMLGGWKAQVECLEVGDAGHGMPRRNQRI